MRYAMILGIIGLVLTIIGSIQMWEPPVWNPVLLILLILPCAWLGEKLKTKNASVN